MDRNFLLDLEPLPMKYYYSSKKIYEKENKVFHAALFSCMYLLFHRDDW